MCWGLELSGSQHPHQQCHPPSLAPYVTGSLLATLSPQMYFVWPAPMFGEIWTIYEHLQVRKFHIKISISGSS